MKKIKNDNEVSIDIANQKNIRYRFKIDMSQTDWKNIEREYQKWYWLNDQKINISEVLSYGK